MSNLKQLKLRISGVKSTQKITKAMKMVAASKLLKSQEQKDQAKPYADKMSNMVGNIAASVLASGDSIPLLTGNGKDQMHLLVLVSSDKGLCGGFNASIAKKTKAIIQKLNLEGKKYKILCLGKKAYDQIKSSYKEKVIEVIPSFSNKKLDYEQAVELSHKIAKLFEEDEFDICSFVYAEFQNAIKQNVMVRKLIPLVDEASNDNAPLEQLYEYEPKQHVILEQMLPLNLAVQIYYILLESIASEHGARMTAMDSATNNANDMIDKLTLLYNRSRQAAITKELIEIVSSAEVV
ncbi:MAG: F0F1 ATP synthase subunit gamma [Rickettsiales bacterium]|jgi:F-type H+-transporting ATPase subunit gamma|nr:F0F1 ATP synthase subunit gamma [Rickettsiales bacterium]